MSAKMIAASRSNASIGCKVTWQASSSVLMISRMVWRWRSARYSAMYRPACLPHQLDRRGVHRLAATGGQKAVLGQISRPIGDFDFARGLHVVPDGVIQKGVFKVSYEHPENNHSIVSLCTQLVSIFSIFRGFTCCGRSPDRATTGTVGDRPELSPDY